MSDLTPEERVRRVKAALAEAGWPTDGVVVAVGRRGLPVPHVRLGSAPRPAVWRAFFLADPTAPRRCWPCWRDRVDPEGCDHDPLTSPWPEVVR